MTRLPSIIAAWIAVLALCVSSQAKSQTDGKSLQTASTFSWVSEAHGLRELIEVPNIIRLAGIVALGLLIARITHYGIEFGWRLGLDPHRRLAAWFGALQLAVITIVLSVIVARLFDTAPGFTLTAVAVALGTSVFVFATSIQNLWAGVILQLRRQMREGDRIATATQTGFVRKIGFLHTEIMREDGVSVFLPNRIVRQDVVAIESAKATAIVRVQIFGERIGLDGCARIRRAAALSPYRAPHT